jgi:hypothetical protein
MSIICGCCGTELDDDGTPLEEQENEEWCDNCDDYRPFNDGVCMRCGE